MSWFQKNIKAPKHLWRAGASSVGKISSAIRNSEIRKRVTNKAPRAGLKTKKNKVNNFEERDDCSNANQPKEKVAHEESELKNSLLLQRGILNRILLWLLGFHHWGIEQTGNGLNVLGRAQKHISFSELAEPISVKKSFVFLTTIVLPLKDDRNTEVAGLKFDEATNFVLIANEKFRQYVIRQYEIIERDLKTLAGSAARLDRPRRYPAACLVDPFVKRATEVLQMLPFTIPDGVLSVEQQNILDSVIAFQQDSKHRREASIKVFIATELKAMRKFFDTIESNPLTPEQRLAVVTDEDATLVLAGAGSGKTSVIVAKAAYLIERNIRPPEEILLMAFGKDAATEMADRIKKRSGVTADALTFHALGNRIIRDVEGRSPPLAEHATDDAKFRALLKDILINDLARRPGLKSILLQWFSEFYFPYKNEWDFKTHDEYSQWVEANDLRTLNGDKVKSFEELEIGNWLYRNGIAHEYEPIYPHDLPSGARGSYKPDFRLIESGVYIEHFGVRKSLNSDGSTQLTTAPYIDRERYLEGMEWKRLVHRENGTILVETFSYEKVEGHLLESLKEKLAPYVKLKPVPVDQMFDTLSEMGQVDAFTQTLGTFLRHFKGSESSIEQCADQVKNSEGLHRGLAFLKIFRPFIDAYQKRLNKQIDFEDMINRAILYVESGRYQSPYRHLLVDEFQDISAGRARLLRALKAQHSDARIFAVGDDWQSIFRFAGSDIHLMRGFGDEFGGCLGNDRGIHSIIDLGHTFRSVDKIALPARRFILQNPSQIEKKVVTAKKANAPAITVASYSSGQEDVVLRTTLEQLSKDASRGTSVLLLGRYNYLAPKKIKGLASDFPKLLLRFMTVHRAKGLEADHVIILQATSGRMGFPSEIVDDPILDMILPSPEKFDYAEERRLFYVALTRAKKSVTIFADRENPSAFIHEFVNNPECRTI